MLLSVVWIYGIILYNFSEPTVSTYISFLSSFTKTTATATPTPLSLRLIQPMPIQYYLGSQQISQHHTHTYLYVLLYHFSPNIRAPYYNTSYLLLISCSVNEISFNRGLHPYASMDPNRYFRITQHISIMLWRLTGRVLLVHHS